ncbi:MAG: hypothetical protein A2633_02190 [Candidatus Sungbacteria bacterium RIFCSPHIGHO2_01_FULL_47_32]|uniref:Uncharacterized protein n=1 Tax=Candidatus Sungbacteria bacterium RIFCSPHIGHO2_01_FULL_47_32 TaxID=1802264 RepID=A0A1G2K745_9BACT|nr:MAG: hypothetical protein A2633_02190 [Candidatus Sungbacteria bacterium RIFCSPHIGHO2_01_FULL_47_32]
MSGGFFILQRPNLDTLGPLLFVYEAPRSRATRYLAEFFRSRIPSFARLRRASDGLFSSPSSLEHAMGYSAKENNPRRIPLFLL